MTSAADQWWLVRLAGLPGLYAWRGDPHMTGNTIVSGPYPSLAAANAAKGGHKHGQAGTQWWIVSKGGPAYVVSGAVPTGVTGMAGPYSSRAAALAAIPGSGIGPVGGGGPRSPRQPGTPAIPATGPVTPHEIYSLLLKKGLSTTQAIGVMANMINESSLNPEARALDTNGRFSNGLIQWNESGYPNSHSLVTGNPQRDVRAQIDYLFSSTGGLSQGLAGATAADVAGNFAQHVEVCTECAPGASQWVARRGNAATVARWISTGHWPKAAGGQFASGGGSSSGATVGGPGAGCIVKLPSVGPLGGACLLTTSQARAVIGGLMITAAIPIGMVGAIVLAAFTFRRSGAGAAIGRSAEAAGAGIAVIPGMQGAGAAVAAAGSAEARRAQGQRRERQQRQGERTQAREQAKAKREGDAQARNDEALAKKVDKRTSRQSSRQAPPDEPPF